MPDAKEETQYDVFISYRRGAGDELALLLQRELKRNGLKVFLDRDLEVGLFEEIILNHIATSAAFLVILTPHSLDRCVDEKDWVRKEIVHAIDSRRNIIPLTIDSFQFTPEMVKSLDPAIREISRYQSVEYSRTYFDSTIGRIVRIVQQDKVERKMEETKERESKIELVPKEKREDVKWKEEVTSQANSDYQQNQHRLEASENLEREYLGFAKKPTITWIPPTIGAVITTLAGLIFLLSLQSWSDYGKDSLYTTSEPDASNDGGSMPSLVITNNQKCPTAQFQGVTPAQWECVKRSKFGMTKPIEVDKGSNSEGGVSLGWDFNRQKDELSIKIFDKPFFMPCQSFLSSTINRISNCKQR